MSLALSTQEAEEARVLVARLGVLLRAREEAPAAPTVPVAAPGDLTEADFADAAATLRCAPVDIRAVYEVESSGQGFGHDGRPTLLFEPHVFSRLTGHRFDSKYGGVSYETWGAKPYPTGSKEARHTANWDKVLYAAKLDRDAAYQAASYGAPQILGQNFRDAGFPTVHAFVEAMSRSARDQLLAFVSIILAWKLDDELREHRWADLARRYNGPAYARNKYDVKLAAAHAKWSKA